MSHKRKGQLTMAGEWAKHLRKWGRRVFWKGERSAERELIRKEIRDGHQDVHHEQRHRDKPQRS